MTNVREPNPHHQVRAVESVAIERRSDLTEAAVADAVVVVAALLADPFDRDARTEARTWLTTWMAAHPDRRSMIVGAAKGGV
jgi:hypothetical protein